MSSCVFDEVENNLIGDFSISLQFSESLRETPSCTARLRNGKHCQVADRSQNPGKFVGVGNDGLVHK